MRRCPRCGRDLEDDRFNWRDKARTRRQSYCRDCSNAAWRDWYGDSENKARHLAQLSIRRRKRIERNRRIIRKLKKRPCVVCGRHFPPDAMDFDHVGPKTDEIPRIVVNNSTVRLLEELRHCEVVCATCHRIRTSRRRLARP